MIKIGIYGASGYTGQELLKILVRHPEADVVVLTSRKFKGLPVSDIYPVFKDLTDQKYIDASPEDVASLCDVIFLAVPHGEAMEVAPYFLEKGEKVIDLSADYRLRDIKVYEKWYKKHTSSELIRKAVYGLPELYRNDITGANLIANPGCYPTGVILALAPVLKEKYIDISSVIVDSKSGVSGAGRELSIGSLFCEANEGLKAYKICAHRHTPEIEQELSILAGCNVTVSFVPHLIPVSRGILSTIYATLQRNVSVSDLVGLYKKFYRNDIFIRIYDDGTYPNISCVRGSNYCDIGFALDDRTGRVIIIAAIDNLMKGAAGQAVQNMNLMSGFPEDMGLNLISLFP